MTDKKLKKILLITSVCIVLAMLSFFVLPYRCFQSLDNAFGKERAVFTKIYDKFNGFVSGDSEYISVSVQGNDSIKITSENPVRVKPGESVSFDYELEERCILRSLSNGFYEENGKIKLDKAEFPVTCIVDASPIKSYKADITVADFGGNSGNATGIDESCYASGSGVFDEGATVTLSAEKAENFVFVCFTSGAPAADGGKVISEDSHFSFEINENICIYANYRRTHSFVTFTDTEGITRTPSDSIITVPVGENCSVSLSVSEGYKITGVSAGTVDDSGTYLLSQVTQDTKVDFLVKKLEKFAVSTSVSDTKMGTVKIENGDGPFYEGTEITVTASPKTLNYDFTGFSKDKSLADGGTLLEESASYTFTLEANTQIIANFAKTDNPERSFTDPTEDCVVPKNKWLLFYHPNGGINTKTGGSSYLSTSFSNTYYYMPNTQWGNTNFKRDGYVLMGYNTAPDGSGTYYGPGWNVLMPDSGAINLFCQWAKVSDISDFKYTVSGSNIIITSYKGNDTFVVIPETINGKKVVRLSKGFLSDNSNVEKLFISANIRTIDTGAVSNCPNLRAIYFSDTVTSVTDGWYTGCPEMSTLYMMAMKAPHYSADYAGTCAIKFELIQVTKGPKLIFSGGSNTILGIDSAEVQKTLAANGKDYTVINLGVNAIDSITFYLEFVSHFINDGDIIVHCPEVHAATQFGSGEIVRNHWAYFEDAYEVFSYVDIRHYYNVFSTFQDCNKARTTGYTYEDYIKSGYTINRSGDFTYARPGIGSNYKATVAKYDAAGEGTYGFETALTFVNNPLYSNELNRVFDMCSGKGATILFSFGVLYDKISTKATQTKDSDVQKAYEAAIDSTYHATRISSCNDYLFESKYIFDSPFHLNDKGVPIRTKKLTNDLLNYFASVDK